MAEVGVSLIDNVLSVRLNRPEAGNAYHGEMVREVCRALKEEGRSEGLRAIVLSGEGKNFCTGADLGWIRGASAGSMRLLLEMYDAFHSLDVPLVVSVQGNVFGGGVGLTACADVAIASVDTTFCLSETRLGLVPGIITPFVVRRVGEPRFRELALTGRKLGAAEALQAGLVNTLVSPDEREKAIAEVLDSLRKGAPGALRSVKRALRELDPCWTEAQKEFLLQWIEESRGGAEAQERIRGFQRRS